MNQPALDLPGANARSTRALAAQIVDHNRRLENHIVHISIEFWLSRRLHIEPTSSRGRLAAVIFHSLTLLLPALLLAAITGQWAGVPLVAWSIACAGYGGFLSSGYPLFWTAIGNLQSWVGSISDEADLRRYTAWHKIWYSRRMYILASAVLTLAALAAIYYVVYQRLGVPFQVGAVFIVAGIIFLVAHNLYGTVMIVPEAHLLSSCKRELYRMSPADTVHLRRSLRGYNQLGAVFIAAFTTLILLLVTLLPGGAGAIAPIVLALLVVEYLCCGAAVLLPRLIIERLIRAKKEEEMEVLQRQLGGMLPRVGELTEEEHEEITQLREIHDAICDSPENLLPFGAVVKVVGALLLSTLTVLATTFAEQWLAEWAKRFVP
jgi:hypothetical protein